MIERARYRYLRGFARPEKETVKQKIRRDRKYRSYKFQEASEIGRYEEALLCDHDINFKDVLLEDFAIRGC